MKKYDNVDLDSIQYPPLFRLRQYEECLEIFRQKKHCIKKIKEDRWFRIPISFELKENEEYSVEIEVKSTYPMKRVFFISQKNKTVRLEGELEPDQWTTISCSFVSEFTGKSSITITATDIPIAGQYIILRKMIVKKKRRKSSK